MNMELVESIRTYILENFLFTNDTSELGLEDSLLEKGVVDSTGMMEIITYLESELGVAVADEEMTPENLDSVSRLAAYVARKRGQ